MPDSSAPTPPAVDPARYPDLCEICARHGRHELRYPHHGTTWICWWATETAAA